MKRFPSLELLDVPLEEEPLVPVPDVLLPLPDVPVPDVLLPLPDEPVPLPVAELEPLRFAMVALVSMNCAPLAPVLDCAPVLLEPEVLLPDVPDVLVPDMSAFCRHPVTVTWFC